MSAGAPLRTCVGCRSRAPRSELLRVARGADGTVRVDPTGTAPGRGAYVHRDSACVEAATRHGALARALRGSVGSDELDRLRELTREIA